MVFDQFMRDEIEIIKADNGATIPSVRANVASSRKISIMNPDDLVIDVNDLIQRRLPNGATETYRVINPEFRQAFHGIPPRYDLHVVKLGLPEAKAAIQNITNNFTINGPNARINNNSLDSSTNVVNVTGDFSNHIAQIRSAIEGAGLSEKDRSDATDVIDAVESQLKAGTAKRSVITALLSALPKIASVTNAVASLIGGLEKLSS